MLDPQTEEKLERNKISEQDKEYLLDLYQELTPEQREDISNMLKNNAKS